MNQRRHVRHVVKPRIYVTLSGSNAGGILHDISDDGVALDIVESKPPEQRVFLYFDMCETGDHFEGLGRVIWGNEPASRIGIQFVDLSEASRNKIRNWLSVKSAERDPLQNIVVQDWGASSSMDTPLCLAGRTSARAASVLERRQNEVARTDNAGNLPPEKMGFEPVLPAGDNADRPPRLNKDHPVTHFQVPFSRTPGDDSILSPGGGVPLGAASADRNPYRWKDSERMTLIVTIICVTIIPVAVLIKVLSTGRTPLSVQSSVATSARNSTPHQTANDAITNINTDKPVSDDQFQGMDAQHGGPHFPRSGTNLVIQANESLPTQPARSTSPLSDASRAKTGRISQQFSGALPVVETILEYPTFALQTNIEGRVILNATVGTEGTLHNEHLVSSPSMLDGAVLDAVKRWRYHPHLQNGKPVEVETQITVDFSITVE